MRCSRLGKLEVGGLTAMQPAINLVCTRCTDGNHSGLQRWYNDHAQLLMASPQLQGGELFRLKETTERIDYLCLYHFASLADFPAFDSGQVMSQVRELSNAAPGRSSIDIVKRTQYERVLHRRWMARDESNVQASLFQLPSALLPDTVRWLNDVVYALHEAGSVQSLQAYTAQAGECSELFVLLHTDQAVPVAWHEASSAYVKRPELNLLWQSQAQRIAQWLR
jgi:hypothetical protein